jgi:hypothetical protein
MSSTSLLRARWLALYVLLVPAPALADTSATLATAINIPKGPASIEGFGRAYEVSPASGLPSLSYPIEVPPGRAGHAPQLALRYHAGGGAGVLWPRLVAGPPGDRAVDPGRYPARGRPRGLAAPPPGRR